MVGSGWQSVPLVVVPPAIARLMDRKVAWDGGPSSFTWRTNEKEKHKAQATSDMEDIIFPQDAILWCISAHPINGPEKQSLASNRRSPLRE
jgi:hypothetical protein